MSETSLRGHRVVITGAARGIGFATAQAFIAAGARVAIGDIDGVAAEVAATELGHDTVAFALDVTDLDSFTAFVASAEEALGGIDVFVNNAGVMPIGPFLEVDEALEARSVQINVTGVLTGMRLALRRFTAQGHGHVVNVGSTAGVAAVPGGIAYCAEKAAVKHATEAARIEFGTDRIRFTNVMPAFTNTELIAGTSGLKLFPNVEPSEVADGIVDAVRTGRRDVFVPKIAGPILKSQPLLGRRVRDALNRRLGVYDTFLRFDTSARAEYQDRIKRS